MFELLQNNIFRLEMKHQRYCMMNIAQLMQLSLNLNKFKTCVDFNYQN